MPSQYSRGVTEGFDFNRGVNPAEKMSSFAITPSSMSFTAVPQCQTGRSLMMTVELSLTLKGRSVDLLHLGPTSVAASFLSPPFEIRRPLIHHRSIIGNNCHIGSFYVKGYMDMYDFVATSPTPSDWPILIVQIVLDNFEGIESSDDLLTGDRAPLKAHVD